MSNNYTVVEISMKQTCRMPGIRPISQESQDAWAAKPPRLSWVTAFVFYLQFYEYFIRRSIFNRRSMPQPV